MHTNDTRSMFKPLLFTALLFLLPTMALAAVTVETHTVSGHIGTIEANGAIRLDNGNLYHPSRGGLTAGVQAGQPVTLRYMTNTEEKFVFFECSPGLNAPEKSAPARPQKQAK